LLLGWPANAVYAIPSFALLILDHQRFTVCFANGFLKGLA
jgi:hypothetical protein